MKRKYYIRMALCSLILASGCEDTDPNVSAERVEPAENDISATDAVNDAWIVDTVAELDSVADQPDVGGEDSSEIPELPPVEDAELPSWSVVVHIAPLDPRTTDDLNATVVIDGPSDSAPPFDVSWKKNGQPVEVATAPPTTVLAAETRAGEQWSVHVSTMGTLDDVAVAEVVILNSAPTCVSVGVSPDTPNVAQDIFCECLERFDPDDDPPKDKCDFWVGGVPVNASACVLPAGTAKKGSEVICTLTPSDGLDDGESVTSASVIISNVPPPAPTLQVTPASPTVLDTLSCLVVPGPPDSDGDPISIETSWLVNGQEVLVSNTTVSVQQLGAKKGDEVACSGTASDGEAVSAVSTSAGTVVVNAVPVSGVVSISPDGPNVSNTLECVASGFSDPDQEDQLTYVVEWVVAGQVVAGISGFFLPAGTAQKGDAVRCRVQSSDGVVTTEWVSSPVTFVQNAVPVISSAEILPSQPTRLSELSCSSTGLSDPDDPQPSIITEWSINGTPIDGQPDEAQLTPGDVLVCTLKPTDGVSVGTAVVSPPVTVVNIPPTINAAVVVPNTPTTTAELTCIASGVNDPEGDVVSIATSWLKFGVPIDGATDPTLSPALTMAGDVIRCRLTPTDAFSAGLIATSGAVQITNSAPAGVLSVAPAQGGRFTPFECVLTSIEDPDGDSVTETIFLTVNEEPVGSLPPLEGGDLVGCTATLSDGMTSTTITSAFVTVQNTAPSVGSALISPQSPVAGSDVTCLSSDVTDPEGDPVSVAVKWYLSGTLIVGETGSDLPGSYLSKGATLQCGLVPSDGELIGATVLSPTIVVGNTPPVVSAVDVSPTTPTVQDEFSCNYHVEDPDAADQEQLESIVTWWVDDQLVAEAIATKGQTVRCEVTVTDGAAITGPVASAAVTVVNSSPSVDSASLTPLEPSSIDAVLCVPSGFVDVDGDPPAYTYRWFLDDQPVVDQTTDVLPSYVTTKGQSVACEVTPIDGEASGTPVSSNAIVINNSPPTIEAAVLTPEEGGLTTVFTCSAVNALDPDNDAVTVSYGWLVNNALVPGEFGATYIPSIALPESTLSCQVRGNDGSAFGDTVSSNIIVLQNETPSIGSVAILPAEPTTSDSLTCIANDVADPDDQTVLLTYAWAVNDVAIADNTISTLAPEYFTKGQSVTCSVTASDPYTSSDAAETSVEILNTLPTVGQVVMSPELPTSDSPLVCAALDVTDPDGDELNVSWRWEVSGEDALGILEDTLPSGVVAKGDSVQCFARPFDGVAFGNETAGPLRALGNALPVVGAVALGPTDATVESELSCEISGVFDPDGDSVQVEYEWFINSGLLTSQTSSTLPAGVALEGQSVLCRVTPSDGTSTGVAVTSSTVTIGNSPPNIVSIDIAPADGGITTAFTCLVDATDPDTSDSLSIQYTWLLAGDVIDGASEGTFIPSIGERGQSLVCQAAVADEVDSSGLITSASIVLANTPPTITDVFLSPNAATVSTSLSCSAEGADDVDGDSVAYVYSWLINGEVDSAFDQPNLPVGSTSKGQSVACQVTPSDGSDLGPPVTSDTVVIQNSAPTVATVSISPDTPQSNTPLTCTVGSVSDADGDAVSFVWEWRVDGEVVADAVGESLPVMFFERGDSVTCAVAPTDGTDTGTVIQSDAVLITNTPPSASGVTVTPSLPGTGDDLQCTLLGFDDFDGDPEAVVYAWLADGQLITAQTQAVLPSSVTSKGQAFVCQAMPYDGVDTGLVLLSSSVSIANTPPTVSSIQVGPTDPNTTDALVCQYGLDDPDTADELTAQIAWFIDGGQIASGPELPSEDTQKGHSVQCQVTPTDGEATGVSATSSPVVIGDSPPVLASPMVVPAAPSYCDTLSCFADASDPDGDSIDVEYEWSLDGVVVGQQATLALSSAVPGQTVECRANVGVVSAATSVILLNSAPVVDSVSVSPSVAVVGQELTCNAVVSDPECEPDVTQTVHWFADGKQISMGDTLDTASLTVGTSVVCEVTASDGYQSSTSVTSASVILASPACDPPCSDGLACTDDQCVLGQCMFTPLDGCEPCQTPLDCSVSHLCEEAACVKGQGDTAGQCVVSPRECYDGLSCTLDVCEPDTGCQFRTGSCQTGCVSDDDCNDGNPCTDDLCNIDGTCGNPVRICDDSDPCTFDVCAPDSGDCITVPWPDCTDTGGSCTSDADCPNTGACFYSGCVGTDVKRCLYEIRRCNDYDSCTVDVCLEESGCSFQPLEGCTSGECESAAACLDDNVCTVDACVDNQCAGVCEEDDDCDDDDATTADACDLAGRCQHELTGACTVATDCDDANACTFDTCSDGTCVYSPVLCEDALPCTRDRTPCGVAIDSQALFGEPCSVAPSVPACEPSVGCLHLPELGCGGQALPPGQNGFVVECSSDDDCETGHLCVPGMCIDGTCSVMPKVCPDPGPGALTYCDPASGNCIVEPASGGTTCGTNADCRAEGELSGFNRCTLGFCDSNTSQCVYIALQCNDSNPCTVDTCDVNAGCLFTDLEGCQGCQNDAQCNDGDQCTTDVCAAGGCENLPVEGCNSCVQKSCTVGGAGLECSCIIPTAEACPFVPCQTDFECSDGLTCTLDECLPNGTCANTPIRCRFNESCIAVDGTCIEGAGCAPSPADCPMSCVVDTDCSSPLPCIDAQCVDGTCVSSPVLCDDGDPCTDDVCDPVTEGCLFVADPACSEDPCMVGGDCPNPGGVGCAAPMCLDGLCMLSLVTCDDFSPCTADSCNESGQCQFSLIEGCIDCADDSDCSDGDACTTDTCSESNCIFEPSDACVTCEQDSDCPQSNIACRFPSCDAGLCSYSDIENCIVCNPADPAETIALECGDGLFCTTDACDPLLQICTNTNDPTLPGCKPKVCQSQNDCPTASNCDFWSCDHEQSPPVCVQTVVDGCPLDCQFDLDCVDGDACTIDRCSADGECIYTAKQCVDDLPCTLDHQCEPAVGCSFLPDPDCALTFCETAEDCATGSGCITGACVAGSCTISVLECDDGDPCTLDWCESGGCQAVTTTECQAAPCTTTADCKTMWSTAMATESASCIEAQCVAGECVVSAANCNDSMPCTADSCDPALGCVFAPIQACELGCTTSEHCDDDDANTE
ncbi:MAG: hypothetical protein VX223_04290, partial [Myxococcota bacterium]|nr:hypothetical protein [Myxococcota bacterium]